MLRRDDKDESSSVLLPPTSRRRFCMLSSFLSLRICTVVASRLRRISSWSSPFLTFSWPLGAAELLAPSIATAGSAQRGAPPQAASAA